MDQPSPIRSKDEQLLVLEQASAQAVQLSEELDLEAQNFQAILEKMKDSQRRMQSLNIRLDQTNRFVQTLKEELTHADS